MRGRKIHVTATGKLFHAHTAHHRTKVLLDVREIKQNSGARIQNPE
jgi:2-iminoacetate synthase ThiH